MKIKHVIIDGSNIATEGRDTPSLAQLDEAVQAFVEEYSPDHVTVVVDATFPNRIDRKERQTYEDAVNANELITPPAGAIGRGDAFVLQIARRAGASILSNDSFQEFHGEYPWLFERGRLIGGKPVPHVGWVFMERAPVRGPTSRRAVSEARKVAKSADKEVQKAADVPQEAADTAEPDGAAPAEKPARRRRSRAAAAKAPAPAVEASVPAAEAIATVAADPDGAADRSGRTVEPYNEAMPFIEFVGRHPVGSEVDAMIERFSSHGAYVLVGEARAYVPLRNLAHPAPRSAKGILRVGETRRFLVVSIDPPRRGIDLGVPGVVEVPAAPPPSAEELAASVDTTDASAAEAEAPPRKSRARKATAKGTAKAAAPSEPPAPEPAPEAEAAAEPPARRSRARKAAAAPAPEAEAAAQPPARRSRARKAAAPSESPAPEPAPAAEPPARRSRARKAAAAPAPEAEVAAQPPARRSRARKPPAEVEPAPAAVPAARRSRGRKAAAAPAPEVEPAPAAEAPARKSRARKAAAKAGPAAASAGRRRGGGDDVVVPLAADAGDSAPRGEAAGG
jgi:hypothetical protein